MKRSDATALIFKIIDEHLPSFNMWEKDKMSERILYELLEAGLLPPAKKDLILLRTTYEWENE